MPTCQSCGAKISPDQTCCPSSAMMSKLQKHGHFKSSGGPTDLKNPPSAEQKQNKIMLLARAYSFFGGFIGCLGMGHWYVGEKKTSIAFMIAGWTVIILFIATQYSFNRSFEEDIPSTTSSYGMLWLFLWVIVYGVLWSLQYMDSVRCYKKWNANRIANDRDRW